MAAESSLSTALSQTLTSRTYLHSLLPQVCALCQLLPGVYVRILVLQEQLLQRVQLLLGENGAVAPGPPVHLSRALLLRASVS